MGYTLIDYFNAFQNLKRKKRFSAGVQSAYFSILAEFNLQRFPTELELSTRELKELAGLKSVSTAHECRNVLKNNKLVGFETKRGTTIYTLGTEHLPNEIHTSTERQRIEIPNANRTPHALDYSSKTTLSSGETKTLDVKTDKSTITTIACANSQELDNIIDYWEQSQFGRLDVELISKLEVYLKRYGFSEVKAAMDAAKLANGSKYGVSFNYFTSVLENRNKPKNLPKGGEENAGTGTIERRKPKRNGNEEWRSFKV